MRICPKCQKEYAGYPALSRADNSTEICPSCGVVEALEDFEMVGIITQLAADLDAFGYDYDFYGYRDAVDNRYQSIEDLKKDLLNGRNIDGVINYLNEIVEEHDSDWEQAAQDLINRINALK